MGGYQIVNCIGSTISQPFCRLFNDRLHILFRLYFLGAPRRLFGFPLFSFRVQRTNNDPLERRQSTIDIAPYLTLTMSLPNPATPVKLVLLGEAAVGKSSLVLRFVSNDFQENKEPTIGAAFLTQKCTIGDKTIKYEIWDTAGQERFASLAPMYYRNAQAALVVYDITKPASFIKARHWVKELHEQASKDITIALVGNKYDLVEDDGDDEESLRKVSAEEGRNLAEEEGLLFFETSAKTSYNVNEVFISIGAKIPAVVSLGDQQPAGRLNEGRVDLSSGASAGGVHETCPC